MTSSTPTRRRRKRPTIAEAIEAAAPPGFEELRVSTEGLRLAHFSRTFLRGTTGDFAGLPFELPPFEILVASELLRGRYTDEPAYREGLIGWPRGNGKSGFGSVFGWEGVVVEGVLDAGAEIYLAASVREQARIMFREIVAMRQASPLLTAWTKQYRDVIEVPETGATLRVLSGDRAAGAAHGLRPTRILADELHAWRNPELYYALRSAMHKRPRSLMAGLTTAGFDLNTICGELYLRGLEARDPRFLFLWLELSDADIAEIERDSSRAGELAKRVNPAPWVTPELLQEQYAALPFGVWVRLHGNKWTRTEELWLPPGAWEACLEPELAYDPELPAWGGVDFGARHDTAAIAIAQPQGERIGVWAWVIGVHADKSKPAPPCHELVKGERIDHALVEQRLAEFVAGRGFPDGRCAPGGELRVVGGDPWRMSRSLELLQERGLLAVEYPMTNARMAPASQQLYDVVTGVRETRLAHDGDKVLAAHINAATAKETERGWRLWKLASKAPMDAAIAVLIAVDLASSNAGAGFQLRFLGDEAEVRKLEATISGEERRLALIEAFVELAEPIAWEELEATDAERLAQELAELAGRYSAQGNEELAARITRELARR